MYCLAGSVPQDAASCAYECVSGRASELVAVVVYAQGGALSYSVPSPPQPPATSGGDMHHFSTVKRCTVGDTSCQ